jgi:hypothetical protein
VTIINESALRIETSKTQMFVNLLFMEHHAAMYWTMRHENAMWAATQVTKNGLHLFRCISFTCD